MATYTTNINLKKPAQSDKIRIADFNGNADNIDAAFGADFGQSSKPSVNAAINNLADGLAIVAQGNVHAAISAGQFVYVRGHGTLGEGLYVANQAISANGTLSSSNLDADTSGGLNALNSKLSSASISIDTSNATTFTFPNLHNLNNSSIFKHGLLVWGVSSNSQSAGISFVFVDTSGNVTVFNLTGNTDRTFTGSVSGTTLTITASQTLYGGLKLIWLT